LQNFYKLIEGKLLPNEFHVERFNFRKLNEIGGREQYVLEIENRFSASEALDAEVDVNRICGTINQLSNSMELGTTREAISFAANQKRPKILWNPEGSSPYSQEPSSCHYHEPD
jgi:hypothetical protein